MNWSVRCVKTECSEFPRGHAVLNQTNLLDLTLTFFKICENFKVIEYNTCQIDLMILIEH